MERRKLGKSDLEVTRLGIGTWGLGGHMWRDVDPNEAQRTLYDAVEHGVRLIDTALVYSDGESERRVGQVVKELRAHDHVVVASKIPPQNKQWPAAANRSLGEIFPPQHVVECTENSLRNLKLDAVPLMQLHVWRDEWLDQAEWLALRHTMAQLITQGKVLHWGLSANDHQPASCLRALAEPEIQSVQVIYNIFDPSPQKELFAAAQKHNKALIARCPFDEGALTGAIHEHSQFPRGDFREHYFAGSRLAELAPRLAKLRECLGDHATQLSDLALRFCLSSPPITSVIPGTRQSKHLRANLLAAAQPPLPGNILQKLAGMAWERNWYRANDDL